MSTAPAIGPIPSETEVGAACAGGCGWELQPDEGAYCGECQSKGRDPKVEAAS